VSAADDAVEVLHGHDRRSREGDLELSDPDVAEREVADLNLPPLGPVETKELCHSVLTEEQRAHFEKCSELDLAFGEKGLYVQRDAVAGAFRTIPFKILSFAPSWGLPPVVAEFANRPNGLVLVTGPTGSGKSTTLAAMIDKINSEQRLHIVTVEDPSEYLDRL
jgi:twitching motility protein PilT